METHLEDTDSETEGASIFAEIEEIILAANDGKDLRRWIRDDSEEIKKFRSALQERKYSEQTIRSYLDWAKRFLKHCQDKPLTDLGLTDLDSFLALFANRASNSQRIARGAMMLFYELVLKIGVRTRIRKVVETDNKPLPCILDDDEIRRLLAKLPNPHRLIASFAFGSGLLLSESRSLRLRDFDYDNHRIFVRKSRGAVERETILPKFMVSDLKKWLEEKYRGLPLNEDCYLFPSRSLKSDDKRCLPKSPISPHAVQTAMWNAAEEAGLNKPATCMILRHCFAVSLLESGTNIRTVQKFMGHTRVENTAIYLRVLRTKPSLPVSPLDTLFGHEI